MKRKGDKVEQIFRVMNLKKKRVEAEAHDNSEVLERHFSSLIPKILEFLSGEAASSSNPLPLQNMPQESGPEALEDLAEGPAGPAPADPADGPADSAEPAADLANNPADPAPAAPPARRLRRKVLSSKQAEKR